MKDDIKGNVNDDGKGDVKGVPALGLRRTRSTTSCAWGGRAGVGGKVRVRDRVRVRVRVRARVRVRVEVRVRVRVRVRYRFLRNRGLWESNQERRIQP